jgi:hypothetical protein
MAVSRRQCGSSSRSSSSMLHGAFSPRRTSNPTCVSPRSGLPPAGELQRYTESIRSETFVEVICRAIAVRQAQPIGYISKSQERIGDRTNKQLVEKL